MTPDAHKHAAARSFCFVTTENGEQQDIFDLITVPGVQRSLCLEEVIDDSSRTQVEFPNGVGNQTRDMLEGPQEQEPTGNPVHERRRQPRKYEDTTSSLLKRNTSSGNPGLTMRFLTSLI